MDNHENEPNNMEMKSHYHPIPFPTSHAFESNHSTPHQSTNLLSNANADQKSNGKTLKENQEENFSENPENTTDKNNEADATSTRNHRQYPIFLILVTLVDVVMLGIAMLMNKGPEPLEDNPLIGPSGKVLDKLGARVASEILDGQYYRLFSPIFLHVGIVHLILNLFFQLKTGVVLEQSIGSLKMSIIYIICGIGGNISGAIFLPHLLAVGSSGSLFGLVGLVCVINMKGWKVIKHQPTQKKSLIFTLAGLIVSFVVGLLPMIDNFCHIGGFIVGILCGFVAMPATVITQEKKEDQEGEFYLSYKSKENYIYVTIGLIGLLTYFVGGLVILFDGIEAKKWCSWCSEVDCPSTWKMCEGYH